MQTLRQMRLRRISKAFSSRLVAHLASPQSDTIDRTEDAHDKEPIPVRSTLKGLESTYDVRLASRNERHDHRNTDKKENPLVLVT